MSQLNALASKLSAEKDNAVLSVANYYTPYGFAAEQADFERAEQLLGQHGTGLVAQVFGAASPNLQDRVAGAVALYNDASEGLVALTNAGAEVEAGELDARFQAALARTARYSTRAA